MSTSDIARKWVDPIYGQTDRPEPPEVPNRRARQKAKRERLATYQLEKARQTTDAETPA